MSGSPKSDPKVEAKPEPKAKKNFLVVYVLTLLAIALVLLLFSFLQNRRTNEQISDLQSQHNIFSTSALQSIDGLNERIAALDEENAGLMSQVAALEDSVEDLAREKAALQSDLSDAKTEAAQARIDAFNASDYNKTLVGIFEQMEKDGVAELQRDGRGNITGLSIDAEHLPQQ